MESLKQLLAVGADIRARDSRGRTLLMSAAEHGRVDAMNWLLQQGVDVNLPKTTTKNIKTRDEPLMLTVNKKGELFIENNAVPLDGLEVKIKKIFQNRREKEVVLRADKDVSYGFVIDVIARVKKAGIDKLGMVTEPLD